MAGASVWFDSVVKYFESLLPDAAPFAAAGVLSSVPCDYPSP